MALTLTIGGSSFIGNYKHNTSTIQERLHNKVNVMNMQLVVKSGETHPQEGQEIVFKDSSRFLFGGYVTKLDPIETGEGQVFNYDVESSDYAYILVNKYAQKTYKNQTLKAIVEDLLSEYVHSGYALTTTNVQTGPVIETIAFNHISLRKCFEKLAKLTGYEWYVDYEKDIHFFNKESTPAPETITDSSDNYSSIQISYDTSQVRNSIVVKGGIEETSSYFQQTFVGDDEAREWILREKPREMEYIKLNTVAQDFGVDPLDEETGNDFMFNFQEKYVRCTATTTTPADGDTIEVSYKYEVPVIVKLKSASSIAQMKLIEGGDGVHDFAITEPGIKSKTEARSRALKELAEYADPIVDGRFKTSSQLLGAGSIFTPGQELTINLPTWNISTDTKYLVQEVIVRPVADEGSIYYTYDVRFGGRPLDVIQFLETLAGTETVINATEEIDRIEAVADIVEITETITKDGNVESVAESLSLSEVVYGVEVTPPFQWTNYIGDFENTLDGFSLGCGGSPTSSYVTGRKGIGYGIKIWSTGGDGLACMNKNIGDVVIGDKFRFWAKGWARHMFWIGTAVNIKTTQLSTGDTVSGASTHNLYSSFNGGDEITEWQEFEVEVLANASSVTWWFYNKSVVGEENGAYYDKIVYGNKNMIWGQFEWS